jgi:hypothetical protein
MGGMNDVVAGAVPVGSTMHWSNDLAPITNVTGGHDGAIGGGQMQPCQCAYCATLPSAPKSPSHDHLLADGPGQVIFGSQSDSNNPLETASADGKQYDQNSMTAYGDYNYPPSRSGDEKLMYNPLPAINSTNPSPISSLLNESLSPHLGMRQLSAAESQIQVVTITNGDSPKAD